MGVRSVVKRSALILSALVCVATVGIPAFAQQTPVAAAQPDNALTEIVVTGSRIAAPNEVSTSPIQVVTAKEIQQGGKVDAIDLLNQLPQNFQNSVVDFSNTSSGLSTPGGVTTADLRGLGPQRTLVLVNGRRLGTGDPNTANPNPAPDLDQIPLSLVERVDVVTGGASAVYGSDAIAGVVNFVMKKNFEGVQLDGQISTYMHDNHEGWLNALQSAAGDTPVTGSERDGRSKNFNLLMGTNFADGKGNVTAYLSYEHMDPIVSSERDFGGCQLNLNKAENGVNCFGSSNSNLFGIAPPGAVSEINYSVVGNQFLPYPASGSVPPAFFNSQQYIYMSREDDRYNAGFMGHIDLNDYVKPYAEFMFMDDKTTEVVAPSGLFQSNPTDPTGNGQFNINCSNPLLSAQQASILCTPAQIAADTATPGSASANINIGRRNIEGGGRLSYWDHTNYRGVGGATGDFGGAWNYDAYASYYYTTLYNANQNYFNYTSIDNALQVTKGPNGPVCISGPPCVPYNIFQQGGVTQAAIDYLNSTGTSNGSVTERILHGDITGDLGKYGIKSPLASDGIGVNLGAEHRNDNLNFAPDGTELSGLLSGFGGASVAVDNSTSVKEEFIELRAPLVQKQPFAEDLMFDTGFRHSDYNLSGGVNTYKFEVQYAPISDLRFRGGYQKAIRAPSVLELYTPQSFGGISAPGIDPCAPTVDSTTGALIPATASAAACAHSGVSAVEYGNGGVGGVYTGTIKQCVANQCNQLQGGNTNLKPEQAESITVGLNFAPSFIPNLTGSIDFYRITVKDEIGVLSAPTILSSCLATGDPTFCNLIVRTSTGSISGSSVATGGYIVQTNLNIGAVAVKGIDLQAAYKHPLPMNLGSMSYVFAGSELLSSTTIQNPGAPAYDCAGLYGPACQTVNPRWRHNLRASWETPWNVEFSALWRFIGPVTLDSNSSQPVIASGTYDAFDAHMPGMNYLDLFASWKVLDSVQIRLGVNNVFDKDPPIVSSNVAASGAANSFPTYDQLGRQLYLAFTAKF